MNTTKTHIRKNTEIRKSGYVKAYSFSAGATFFKMDDNRVYASVQDGTTCLLGDAWNKEQFVNHVFIFLQP